MVKVGIIGGGYWGSNIARVLHESPTFDLVDVADLDYPRRGTCTVDELWPVVDAVIIATPAGTHYAVASQALMEGKHVLVEKPLAIRSSIAEALVMLAAQRELVLMVDHTYVYAPAMDTVRAALRDLGPVHAMHSARMHQGGPGDVNALWDLLPHDLSILQAIAPGWWQGCPEVEVLGDGEAGVATFWWGPRICRVQYSRRSPTKVRHFVFETAEGELVWSDYPVPRVWLDRHGRAEVELPVPPGEALRRMVEAFGEWLITGECAATSGRSALKIIDAIESANDRLRLA